MGGLEHQRWPQPERLVTASLLHQRDGEWVDRKHPVHTSDDRATSRTWSVTNASDDAAIAQAHDEGVAQLGRGQVKCLEGSQSARAAQGTRVLALPFHRSVRTQCPSRDTTVNDWRRVNGVEITMACPGRAVTTWSRCNRYEPRGRGVRPS